MTPIQHATFNFPKLSSHQKIPSCIAIKKNPNQQYKTVGTWPSPTTWLHLTTGIEQALTLAHHFHSNKAHSHDILLLTQKQEDNNNNKKKGNFQLITLVNLPYSREFLLVLMSNTSVYFFPFKYILED